MKRDATYWRMYQEWALATWWRGTWLPEHLASAPGVNEPWVCNVSAAQGHS